MSRGFDQSVVLQAVFRDLNLSLVKQAVFRELNLSVVKQAVFRALNLLVLCGFTFFVFQNGVESKTDAEEQSEPPNDHRNEEVAVTEDT